MDWIKNQRLVLASKSPRRRQLLTEAGFVFEILKIDVDETYSSSETPALIPERLALKKARAGFEKLSDPLAIVLGADSMVFLGDRIFEKPQDHNDAFRMLASLSGKTHLVITGVALISRDKALTFSSKTYVTMRDMDKDEIEYYIKKYEPYDKAGAYGIQDWLGHCKVSEISGTYTNVMGLPVDLVYEGLRQIVLPHSH
ncbi:MAG: Maf family protein [Saprospiraceae bacterium]|nr:Maf family protein [Saprospiraceae bacterium]